MQQGFQFEGTNREAISFHGRNFYRYPDAPRHSDAVYYRGWWHGVKTYLHRAVWEKLHGPIPAGFDVHHIDENASNNPLDGSNYELIELHEHRRHHAPKKGRKRLLKSFLKKCLHCHKPMLAKTSLRKYCNANCTYHYYVTTRPGYLATKAKRARKRRDEALLLAQLEAPSVPKITTGEIHL